MRAEIKILSDKFEALMVSPKLTFDEVAALKDKMGVYMIYENDHLVYVGKTNKMHIRFGTDLKHETTHTLVRKMIKNEKFLNRGEVVNYFRSNCLVRIEFCDSNREAEALEGIAICILNPEYNRL